jgi:hypothetical protein
MCTQLTNAVEVAEAFMLPLWDEVSDYSDASGANVLSTYDQNLGLWYQSSMPEELDLSLSGSNEMII